MSPDWFRGYQDRMYRHVLINPYCGLFAEPGLGKTSVIRAAADWLMNAELSIRKTLVIAPYNVADTVWSDERDKWPEFRHMTIAKIMGTVSQRIEAARSEADIYMINVENVAWLVSMFLTSWPFDFVVFDESSLFKSADSQRFRNIIAVRPYMKRVAILTGTPVPNGLHDLWSQMFLVDEGERLGTTLTAYRNEYLFPKSVNEHKVTKWGVTDDNAKRVFKQVEDVCISLKEKDYLKLPPLIYTDHKVKLSDKVRKQYDQFEKDQVMKFFEDREQNVVAVNAGVLTMKLQQFAAGSVYDEDGETVNIHKHKYEVLEEIIDAASGEPVLILYEWQHQLQYMLKKFGGHLFKRGDSGAWNEGKYSIMYLHRKSGGHGLNLQAGGCIQVWMSPTWSTEGWIQTIKRIHRSGQKRPCIIHRLIATGTMDVDAVRSVKEKQSMQEGMMNALKLRFKKYTK